MPNKTRPSHFRDIKADSFRIADHPEVRPITQYKRVYQDIK